MFPISGRLRAASPNCRLSSPSRSTVMLPLLSWIRKLKPAEAPKPEIVGMLNGKITASGMRATWAWIRAMKPRTCISSPCRSCQGFNRTKIVPKLGW
jgi:hypothetical protein